MAADFQCNVMPAIGKKRGETHPGMDALTVDEDAGIPARVTGVGQGDLADLAVVTKNHCQILPFITVGFLEYCKVQAAFDRTLSRSTLRSHWAMNVLTSGVASQFLIPRTWTTFLPRTSTV